MRTTISKGVAQQENLIPIFLDELKKRDQNVYEILANCFAEVIQNRSYAAPEGNLLYVTIMAALRRTAPDGYHFGATYIDGHLCYGFWELGVLADIPGE